MQKRTTSPSIKNSSHSLHKSELFNSRQTAYTSNRPNFILRSSHQKRTQNFTNDQSKQKLKLQLINFKNQYTEAKQQNIVLKTKIQVLQKQASQLKQIALSEDIFPILSSKQNTNIIYGMERRLSNLKQLFHEQQQKNKILMNQLQNIKKSNKYVRIKQLEEALKNSKQDAVRLRSLLCMEEKQGYQEASSKNQAFRKVLRQLQNAKKQLVYENQDYKFRLKTAGNLVQKQLKQGNQEVKISKFQRLIVLLKISPNIRKKGRSKQNYASEETSPEKFPENTKNKGKFGQDLEQFYKKVTRRQFVYPQQDTVQSKTQIYHRIDKSEQGSTEKYLKVVEEGQNEGMTSDLVFNEDKFVEVKGIISINNLETFVETK